MGQFLSQYGWLILVVGLMLFMHRPGSTGGGCCGGHQHGNGDRKTDDDQSLKSNVDSNAGSVDYRGTVKKGEVVD